MDNIYRAPESNLNTDTEKVATLRQLFKEQSVITLLFVSFFGVIPTLVFIAFLVVKNHSILWLIFLPGLGFSIFLKLLTRTFSFKLRLIPVLLLVAGLTYFVVRFNANPLILLTAFTNGILVLVLSKRSLTEDQKIALYSYRVGRIKI